MAERAGISPMTVQRLEKGEGVRAGSWRAVARAFGVDEDKLVSAVAQPNHTAAIVADVLGLARAATDPVYVAVTAPDGTVNLHDVRDIKVTQDGVETGTPRRRLVDVTETKDSEPYLIVDAVVGDVGGPDRVVAEALIEVRAGTMWVQGVNEVVKAAPIHTIASGLVSRLMGASTLTSVQREWLRATLAVVDESVRARYGDDGGDKGPSS